MPATKKFSTIFELMDRYTDEDSDVQLLTGVAIPKQGPVYIPAQTAVVAVPEPRDDSQVSEPSRCSAVAKSPAHPPSFWTAATTAPAGEPRGTVAAASDKAAVIAKNKQAALDRRVQLQAAAARDREQQIFENQQWPPT